MGICYTLLDAWPKLQLNSLLIDGKHSLWQGLIVTATVEIAVPDILVKALGSEDRELPRRALEALIVQAYRKRQITHAQVAEFLSLDRFETDHLLKEADGFRSGEDEEFSSDLEKLRRISKR